MILKRILLYRLKQIDKKQLVIAVCIMLLLGCTESATAILDAPSFLSPAIAYQPRGFLPGSEKNLSKKQISEDLRLLRKSGFRSLVTYGSNSALGSIPEIARNEGFDGMIVMGIWDIFSKDEWNNALKQAPFVNGYCLGNEGLGIRYSTDALESKMIELRRLTGKPVTTSEPMNNYFMGPYREWLLSNSDWLFPNFIPTWDHKLNTDQLVRWIISYHDYFAAMTEKPVILKEAGYPTAVSEYGDEETQLSFFKAMESTGISFFHFEAFDQPWKRDILKHPEIEAHWGLFSADGKPKKIIHWLAKQSLKK